MPQPGRVKDVIIENSNNRNLFAEDALIEDFVILLRDELCYENS